MSCVFQGLSVRLADALLDCLANWNPIKSGRDSVSQTFVDLWHFDGLNLIIHEVKVTKLIGLSGSLRQGSFNSALLRAATALMPEGSELVAETIHGIPLYDGDLEAAEGIPRRVTELKEAIAAADGLLLVTPEYNNSIPGVFKNAIDWFSRPSSDIKRVFGGRPVALIGASQGGFGTILSQNAWLPVLHTLGASLWSEGRLMVSRAQAVFNQDGTLTDQKIEEQLRNYLQGFVAFARSSKRARSGS
jgi:chromate reductase, NAD(P)H dehydrogenase (quinone)